MTTSMSGWSLQRNVSFTDGVNELCALHCTAASCCYRWLPKQGSHMPHTDTVENLTIIFMPKYKITNFQALLYDLVAGQLPDVCLAFTFY